MKIGIIGHGFVGSAIAKSLIIKNFAISVYDKYKNMGSFELVLKSDIIFLCLPTPYSEKNKSYDVTEIMNSLNQFNDINFKGILVIKSTVEPGFCKNLKLKFLNLNICHNPEFLSSKTAFEDFHNQKHIVIGCTTDSKIDKLITVYKKSFPNSVLSICKSDESESMKLMCNSFYASKIILFNEFFLLCKKLNIDYSMVKKLMLQNKWINPMHTNVPGHDSKFGFGGNCFPKDIKALDSCMTKNNQKSIFSIIIERCAQIREEE